MKVFAAIFLAIGAIAIVVLGLPSSSGGEREFFRFHIRANSDSMSDQAVKHAIQQEVINEFTPIFAGVTTIEEAMATMRNNLGRIEEISNNVLIEHGKSYLASARLSKEHFPTRNYRHVTLPEGLYNALIIDLGAGAGQNWWCVIYPPLCFLNNDIGGERGVVYRSRLNEIINRFFR